MLRDKKITRLIREEYQQFTVFDRNQIGAINSASICLIVCLVSYFFFFGQ